MGKVDYITISQEPRLKKVKVETGTINKLPNIPTDHITYAGPKLVSDKIDVPLKNQNKNSKPGWEIRLGGQTKKLRQQAKIQKKEQKIMEMCCDEKTKTKQLTNLIIQL